MLRITKKFISAILALVCLTFPIISLSACGAGEGFTGEVNPEELHKFDFYEAPREAYYLFGSDQANWAKENGYVVIGGERHTHPKNENIHLLRRFIKDKNANTEISIIISRKMEGNFSWIHGLYFDGEYFQTHLYNVPFELNYKKDVFAIYKYKTCEIEKYDGVRYLYVANGNSISLKEYLKLDNDGKAAVKEKFLVVASWE